MSTTYEPCRSCFGRGYKPEKRRRATRVSQRGPGSYLRTCRSCGGSGSKPKTTRGE